MEKTLGIMNVAYCFVLLKIFCLLFDILICTLAQATGLDID